MQESIMSKLDSGTSPGMTKEYVLLVGIHLFLYINNPKFAFK